jgi:hypothetical protein
LATFWENFSQTHLVTLVMRQCKLSNKHLYIKLVLTDSKMAPVTTRVNSLEAFLIRVAKYGGRESTRGNDLILHQSLRHRKENACAMIPVEKKLSNIP